MAGLLDFLDNGDAQLGLGLLAAASARSDGAGFGQRLLEGVGHAQNWKQQKKKDEYAQLQFQQAQMQMEEMQRKRDEAARQRKWQEGLPSMLNKKVYGAGEEGPTMAPDTAGLQNYLLSPDSPFADKLLEQRLFPKADDFKVVGDSLIRIGSDGVSTAYTAPQKAAALPSSVQEYQFAKEQGYPGTYQQWTIESKKAGATNIGLPKIEIKMGEGVASQVGPMVKDSKIQAGGAVKMFDAADRIERAISSNAVTTGPFATQVQTVKQLVQNIAGGNDEGIRQTRQVIKSLAQMSVEARKQLQGQGQVTESEAAAVAKADAGDINDLTVGELKDLVTLTKRASHYTAKAHQEMLTGLGQSEATNGLVKFYQVPGMDTLLQHTPQLPQIGGATGVDSLVKKYQSKK